jgi:hypothetical protein
LELAVRASVPADAAKASVPADAARAVAIPRLEAPRK